MVCASREKDVYSRIEVTAHGRRVNPGIFGDRGQRDVADSTGCRESACRIKEVAPIGIKVTIIEPGAFRTDWAGDSMAITDTLHEDYQPTVGGMIESVRASSGNQAGDPARSAQTSSTSQALSNHRCGSALDAAPCTWFAAY
jgi:hypothetical protein